MKFLKSIVFFSAIFILPSCALKQKKSNKTTQATKSGQLPSFHEYRAMIDRD